MYVKIEDCPSYETYSGSNERKAPICITATVSQRSRIRTSFKVQSFFIVKHFLPQYTRSYTETGPERSFSNEEKYVNTRKATSN